MDPVTMRGRANTRPRSRVQSADDPGRDAGLSGVTTLAALPVPDTNPVVEPSGELINPGRVLVAYRGLPGSGKTTHAEAQVTALRQAGTAVPRVSRDDIRASMRLTAGGTPDQPDRVTAVHHAVWEKMTSAGAVLGLLARCENHHQTAWAAPVPDATPTITPQTAGQTVTTGLCRGPGTDRPWVRLLGGRNTVFPERSTLGSGDEVGHPACAVK
jgi:hypothetical protein